MEQWACKLSSEQLYFPFDGTEVTWKTLSPNLQRWNLIKRRRKYNEIADNVEDFLTNALIHMMVQINVFLCRLYDKFETVTWCFTVAWSVVVCWGLCSSFLLCVPNSFFLFVKLTYCSHSHILKNQIKPCSRDNTCSLLRALSCSTVHRTDVFFWIIYHFPNSTKVCISIFVRRITQKQLVAARNLVEGCAMGQGRTHYLSGAELNPRIFSPLFLAL